VAWSAVILFVSSDFFSARNTGAFLHDLLGRDVPYTLHIILRKLGHLLGYGILGALAFRAARVDIPRRPILSAFAVVLLVAGIDEMHQATLASRTGSGWDVVLDLIGASIAVWLLRRTHNNRLDM